MWYNIRQRFGKERRKVVTSLKGKSGQGTKPVYVPKWKFYDLCLFLVDHITPRKTVSNYMSNKNVKNTTTIGKISPSPIFIFCLHHHFFHYLHQDQYLHKHYLH
ncbi:PREDICTED: uncharacterized protein LOC105461833, partial [Wasmannia auropunctata]|uniref:uncharacterized protein LOC105461833 n=1 Tax=Wasmannia auropunctata TaxID=64793 RepID=UPI0005EE5EFD